MNIELKYKFNYHFTALTLAALTLLFSAISILQNINGSILLPFIAATSSCLMCVDKSKKKLLSAILCSIITIVELILGLLSYYTPTVLFSVILAAIIAFHFMKSKNKNESVFWSVILISLAVLFIVVLFIISTTNASSLSEVYDEFLLIVEDTKSVFLEYTSANSISQVDTQPITREDIDTMFDAYIDCIVAFVAIVSFIIVGITNKIFSIIMRFTLNDSELIDKWRFMPSSVFAYFYFVISALTLFAGTNEDIFTLSMNNLHLILTFVFAYIGFVFIRAIVSKNGRPSLFLTVLLLMLILSFSSIAIQILAIAGGFIAISCAKLNNSNTKNDSSSNR